MKAQLFTPELSGYSKLIRRMGKDQRLYATHISLFTALFVCWQRGGICQSVFFQLPRVNGV